MYKVVPQQYADNMQLYITMSKMSSASATTQLENCVTALYLCFADNRLGLNPDKLGAVLFSTAQFVKELSAISTVDAAGSTIALSSKIKHLGVMLDGNLNLYNQVNNVCTASLFHIHVLRHICLSLTEEMANIIACALIQL